MTEVQIRKNNSNKRLFKRVKANKYAYILILPALIYVTVFAYMPMGGILMAFKNFDIIKGISESPWVGFENFKKVFSDENMLLAVKNTIVYGATILFGAFPFPIILAILFNELRGVRFKKVVQTVSYMPYFLSWVSVISLFYTFLALEGPINQIIGKIVGESYVPVNILMEAEYFLPVIFVSHLWKNVGWSSVIYLASIAGIDPVLYEAAMIDGCGRFKQVWHITLPSIRSTALIVFIMSVGTLFSTNFEQVFGFQNVYTQNSTEVINTLIYRSGIENGNYSQATAFGLAQGLVTVTLTFVANAISKKLAGTSIW